MGIYCAGGEGRRSTVFSPCMVEPSPLAPPKWVQAVHYYSVFASVDGVWTWKMESLLPCWCDWMVLHQGKVVPVVGGVSWLLLPVRLFVQYRDGHTVPGYARFQSVIQPSIWSLEALSGWSVYVLAQTIGFRGSYCVVGKVVLVQPPPAVRQVHAHVEIAGSIVQRIHFYVWWASS